MQDRSENPFKDEQGNIRKEYYKTSKETIGKQGWTVSLEPLGKLTHTWWPWKGTKGTIKHVDYQGHRIVSFNMVYCYNCWSFATDEPVRKKESANCDECDSKGILTAKRYKMLYDSEYNDKFKVKEAGLWNHDEWNVRIYPSSLSDLICVNFEETLILIDACLEQESGKWNKN